MHASYEAYARGEVNFPRILIVGEPEELKALPKKTQAIATALHGAWQRIEAGKATHHALVDYHRKNPHEALVKGYGKGIVFKFIGENALALTLFIPVEGGVSERNM